MASDFQKEKQLVKNANTDIPAIISQLHPKMKYEQYQVLSQNPMFLNKTASTCLDCYLEISSIEPMAGLMPSVKQERLKGTQALRPDMLFSKQGRKQNALNTDRNITYIEKVGEQSFQSFQRSQSVKRLDPNKSQLSGVKSGGGIILLNQSLSQKHYQIQQRILEDQSDIQTFKETDQFQTSRFISGDEHDNLNEKSINSQLYQNENMSQSQIQNQEVSKEQNSIQQDQESLVQGQDFKQENEAQKSHNDSYQNQSQNNFQQKNQDFTVEEMPKIGELRAQSSQENRQIKSYYIKIQSKKLAHKKQNSFYTERETKHVKSTQVRGQRSASLTARQMESNQDQFKKEVYHNPRTKSTVLSKLYGKIYEQKQFTFKVIPKQSINAPLLIEPKNIKKKSHLRNKSQMDISEQSKQKVQLKQGDIIEKQINLTDYQKKLITLYKTLYSDKYNFQPFPNFENEKQENIYYNTKLPVSSLQQLEDK